MTVEKLSQIALSPSPLASTDFLVGVTGGAVDYRFTPKQAFANAIPPMVDTGIAYNTPTNGFSYTIPNNIWHVVLTPATNLTTGTIIMPAVPIDGQVVTVKTSMSVTTVTVSPNAGQSVSTPPTSLGAGGWFEATYRASNTTWYIEYVAGALINLTTTLDLYMCILAGTIVGGSGYTSGGDGTVPGSGSTVVSGYTNGGAGVALTGGSGTGATANILVTGGAVTAVVPVAQGTGYQIGDVLSASSANIGGTGSGFTFTLTGIGNNLNPGTSVATAFRNTVRIYAELSKYSFAGNNAVTIHISDGFYDEKIYIRALIGNAPGQIQWVGNTTRWENVHFKPSTDDTTFFPTSGVLAVVGAAGSHTMRGFWIDGQAPAFSADSGTLIGTYQGPSALSIGKFRLSFPVDEDSNLFTPNDVGSIISVDDAISCDYGGSQTGFVVGSGDFSLGAVNVTQNCTTPLAIPAFAYQVESSGVNTFTSPNYIGWAGTTGYRFSLQDRGAIKLDFANITTRVLGDQEGIFTSSVSSLGANFLDAVHFFAGDVAFGAPPFVAGGFPTAGTGGSLVADDNVAVFDVFPDAVFNVNGFLDRTQRHFFMLSFNDTGTIKFVPLSNITTGYNYSTPATGFTLVLGNNDGRALINPAGVLALGTVQMCPGPYDGQEVLVTTSQTITGLTVSPNAGQSVVNGPTTLAAGTKFRAIYRIANTTWYCFT